MAWAYPLFHLPAGSRALHSAAFSCPWECGWGAHTHTSPSCESQLLEQALHGLAGGVCIAPGRLLLLAGAGGCHTLVLLQPFSGMAGEGERGLWLVAAIPLTFHSW